MFNEKAFREDLLSCMASIEGYNIEPLQFKLLNRKFYKPVGVVLTDHLANIIAVNRDFLRITQYKKEEVIGKNPRLLQSGHYSYEFYELMWWNLQKNKRWHGEIWDRRKDGSLYLEDLEIIAIQNEHDQTTHYWGIFTEVDEVADTIRETFLPSPGFKSLTYC